MSTAVTAGTELIQQGKLGHQLISHEVSDADLAEEGERDAEDLQRQSGVVLGMMGDVHGEVVKGGEVLSHSEQSVSESAEAVRRAAREAQLARKTQKKNMTMKIGFTCAGVLVLIIVIVVLMVKFIDWADEEPIAPIPVPTTTTTAVAATTTTYLRTTLP